MRYEIKGDTYPLRHCFPPFGLEWDEEDEVYWTDDEEGWREAVEALGRTPPDGARELTVTVDLEATLSGWVYQTGGTTHALHVLV